MLELATLRYIIVSPSIILEIDSCLDHSLNSNFYQTMLQGKCVKQKVAKYPTVCWWICCSYAIITDQHFCNTVTHWAFSFSFSPKTTDNHTCWQQYALCILSLDLNWLIWQEFPAFIFIITWMQMFLKELFKTIRQIAWLYFFFFFLSQSFLTIFWRLRAQ